MAEGDTVLVGSELVKIDTAAARAAAGAAAPKAAPVAAKTARASSRAARLRSPKTARASSW